MVEEEIVTILKEIYQQVREINDHDRDPEDVMYHIQKIIDSIEDY